MPECSILCQALHGRLNACHDDVATHEEQWRTKYCDLLKRFFKLLRRKPLLDRLAGGEMIASTFKELNVKLDDICQGVGLEAIAGEDHWMGDWERGCEFQAQRLRELVGGADPRVLVSTMQGEKLVTKAMLDMYTWLEGNISGKLRELKQETLDRLRISLNLETRVITSETVGDVNAAQSTRILSIFRWFTPERNVEFVGETIGFGSCGIVTRGKWRNRNGEIQDVIVKTMVDENMGNETAFLKQLQFWYDLPQHRNIVQLYAGCHLAKQPFFVCEDVHGRNIVVFLGKEENRGLFWPVFLQVAEGLQFLHDHQIIHDALKGNNILMGENNTPKISDFGSAHVRALSARLSKESSIAQESAVRWKPREKLNERNNDLHEYKSDVYSLGMCMIEVMTQDIPFGSETDDEDGIMAKIIRGESYEQPNEATDEEWSVISKLCEVDIGARPDINQALTLIRSLVPAAGQGA